MKLSTNDIEKRKILFQYALMAVAAFIGGICFIKAVEACLSIMTREKILTAFLLRSFDDLGLVNFIGTTLKSCIPYFISAVLIFIFSFSYVSYAISDIIIAVNAFLVGATITLVALSLPNSYFVPAAFFIISTVSSLFVLFYFAYTSALFSLGIRIQASNGRMVVSSKKLLQVIAKIITALGTFIIFALIRTLALIL